MMPELAAGVYVAPDLTRAVRERIWTVLSEWWDAVPGGSILMAFPDKESAGRLGIYTLGIPPVKLADLDGLRAAVRPTGDLERELPTLVS